MWCVIVGGLAASRKKSNEIEWNRAETMRDRIAHLQLRQIYILYGVED